MEALLRIEPGKIRPVAARSSTRCGNDLWRVGVTTGYPCHRRAFPHRTGSSRVGIFPQIEIEEQIGILDRELEQFGIGSIISCPEPAQFRPSRRGQFRGRVRSDAVLVRPKDDFKGILYITLTSPAKSPTKC
jgi:hypothetical protein